MTKEPSSNGLAKAVHRPSMWLLAIAFLLITFFQYAEALHLAYLSDLNATLGLTRYTVERILYLLPIIWAGLLFGWRGGVITATLAVACMLPRGIYISPNPEDAIVESLAIFAVGTAVAFSLELLQKERERRTELEVAQKELQNQLRVIEEDERRLAALNRTSSIISQSLELPDVLESAINCVIYVMGVEVVRVYILDDDHEELILSAYHGVSAEFVEEVHRIKIGEGFNGRVARTGELLFVENTLDDPELTKAVVVEENIRSQIIVPMMAKGKVVGTIAAAMRSHRQFSSGETDLLIAIANQIGVAVDNARLYQFEKDSREQLKASEERYRGLFENAHDAIWLHDLDDNLITANGACVELTGYTLDELHRIKAVQLISAESQNTTRMLERHLMEGKVLGSRDEVKLTKKDGSEAFVQLASSLMLGDGRPVAFQHIARDVTEEKKMQENLQFFLQQITRAQEEERKRIAQELHDDTVQAMVVHVREIEDISSRIHRLTKGNITIRLEELYDQANVIMNGVRRLSQDLRPAALDRLGLLPAVEWVADQIAEYSGMEINVRFLGEERRLPDEVELVLFRITQEALRNVWKHAQATRAEVIVEFEEKRIRITVEDNGKGFEPPSSLADLPRYGMLGLAGMQERVRLLNGTLSFASELGKGTTVVAELPV